MPTSVRLDPRTEQLVSRLSKQRGQTKSEVIREAIQSLSTQENGRSKGQTPYERVKHLIGIGDSGGQRLSENTGEKFAELLLKHARERHTR